MASYLSTKTAEYTTTELTISPQKVMVEEGQKRQYIHEYDDGDIDVVTASDSYFYITIEWTWLSDTDAATLLSFYDDIDKADGTENSFYWLHPVDGNTYVARFLTDLIEVATTDFETGKEIPPIRLLIEGVKA
jgi:hypothetical protein